MKVPIPLNDLDPAILAFQRSQAALPDLLRYLLASFHFVGHRAGWCRDVIADEKNVE